MGINNKKSKNIFSFSICLGMTAAIFELLSVAAFGGLFVVAQGRNNLSQNDFFNIFNLNSDSLSIQIFLFVLIITLGGFIKTLSIIYSWRVCAKISTHLSSLV